MSKFLAADNLPAWFPLHHFNRPVYNYKTGVDVVDWNKKSLWAFIGMVAFNPIFWNIVARNEYRNKTITKVVRSPYLGCYILAVTIFSLSAFRDSLFLDAVKNQPSLAILDNKLVKAAAVAFFAAGQIFVLSSMWVLGVTGTYLGDYFGILMTSRVTGFPFNVLNDPMYIGSFLTHIGTSLWYQSPAGVALSFWVLFVYLLALRYEGPFTDKIYSAAHKKSGDAKAASSTSTSTSSLTPVTPRKSSRIARKSEIPAGLPSAAGSYADVAAEKPTSDNEIVAAGEGQPVGAQTPRRKARQSVAATPGRMTRSRSKGRGLGGSDGDD